MRLLIFVLFVSFIVPSVAWSDDIDARTQSIYDSTMSPFCPGRTLSACPSGDAKSLREQIRTWVEDGQTDQKIQSELISQYGEMVRGAPAAQGFGSLAWIIPVVFVLLGIWLISGMIRRRGANAKSNPADHSNLSQFREQVEVELRDRLSKGE